MSQSEEWNVDPIPPSPPSLSASKKQHSIIAFEPDHALEVAALVQEYFPFHQQVSTNYLAESLVEHHIVDVVDRKSSPSLVYKAADDTISGFLAVKARDYRFKNRLLLIAHASKFIISERTRNSLMAFRMVQEFFKGPQDISVTDDANQVSRLLWLRLGGRVVPEHSVYFKLPIRPFTFAISSFGKRVSELSHAIARTIALGLDYVASRSHIPYFYHAPVDYHLEYLSNEVLLHGHHHVMRKYDLYPEYDLDTLGHLLHRAQREVQFGQLQRIAILDQGQQLIGWFIYYLNKGGTCELLEAQALPGHESVLFKALRWHVHSNGGVQLSGRLLLSYFGTPFSLHSLTMPGYMWTLMQSKDEKLLNEVMAARTYIPRL